MAESWQLPSGPQASVVQGFWSSQDAAVVQGTQPSWGWCSQTPSALQISVVQASWSSQSAAVVHCTQPGMAACSHAPPYQAIVGQCVWATKWSVHTRPTIS